MKITLPLLLSFNAGYVDTAGYLALHGLFTAHVTGNFVTIGAALVHGTADALTKLLALPVFCLVVVLVRLARYRLLERQRPVLRDLLALKLVLLAAGAAIVIRYGPFATGDARPAMAGGLLLVAGMAVQNAIQRVHLGSTPPTTLMTGTTTQLMLDLADLLHGVPDELKATLRKRLAMMGTAVVAFALGCAMAAWLFAAAGPWCFALPPLLALAAYFHRDARQA